VHELAVNLRLLPGCVPVGCDESAPSSLVEDPHLTARAKRMDIIYHRVRHRVKMQQPKIVGMPLRCSTADEFTKPSAATLFKVHRSSSGIYPT
jgi:hypothetical protein